MYAVIKTGGKQYRVSPGNVLKVESLDAEVGASVNFDEVLMIADGDDVTVGTPTIASAKVVAEVIAHGRAKKIEIIKFRRRKHHQKRTGHRQNFTQIQIQNINGKGAPAKKAKAKSAAKDTDAETKAKPAKKAAPKKSTTKDDLTKIEGIGPKAAEALVTAGLATFADVAKAKVPAIQTILDEADGKFGAMKPDTWPKQAKLAAADKWDELKTLQDELDGGIEKK